MPVLYDDLGIRFQFPENWSLEADDEIEDRPSVTVYSPGGAFWSVVLAGKADDLAQLADEAAAAYRKEYPGLDCEAVQQQVGDVKFEGFDISFIYLDLISIASIRACRTPAGTFLIVSQAEDRDFEKPATRSALTASLLMEAAKAGKSA